MQSAFPRVPSQKHLQKVGKKFLPTKHGSPNPMCDTDVVLFLISHRKFSKKSVNPS